jgi:hypothetical protein
MAAHLTRSECEGCYEVLGYPMQSNWTDNNMLRNGSEEDGDVRSECEEDEVTDCEDGEIC